MNSVKVDILETKRRLQISGRMFIDKQTSTEREESYNRSRLFGGRHGLLFGTETPLSVAA